MSLKRWSTNADGIEQITPDCLTIDELEYQLDQLKKDLDLIGSEARKRYRADELLLDGVFRKGARG